DIGQTERAVVRLLNEANRHGNDPELFAGLVHACRYCGLYEEAIAAHVEARRLDPNVPTSLEQTLLMTCDIDRLLAVERPSIEDRSDRASGRAAAERGEPSWQRSGALRRTRPRLSVLRTVRRSNRRARRGTPARPERPHEPRADAVDDVRHRSASGRRAALDR